MFFIIFFHVGAFCYCFCSVFTFHYLILFFALLSSYFVSLVMLLFFASVNWILCFVIF